MRKSRAKARGILEKKNNGIGKYPWWFWTFYHTNPLEVFHFSWQTLGNFHMSTMIGDEMSINAQMVTKMTTIEKWFSIRNGLFLLQLRNEILTYSPSFECNFLRNRATNVGLRSKEPLKKASIWSPINCF